MLSIKPPITLLTLHEHNIHYTPSTIHSIVFHNPPKHTRHSCKMAQDVEMMWKCCGVIPILFGWFLSVPSLHALVFIQKTILWLVAICTHKAWYVTKLFNERVLCSAYSGQLWARPTLAELTCLCVWKWYCCLNHDTLWLIVTTFRNYMDKFGNYILLWAKHGVSGSYVSVNFIVSWNPFSQLWESKIQHFMGSVANDLCIVLLCVPTKQDAK